MMQNARKMGYFLLIFGIILYSNLAADSNSTRMLTDPAISNSQIVFSYANDLWIAGQDGSNARRLTSAAGTETSPVFSPDGQTVAFSGNYDGNIDVYLVSANGGIPSRLTWHPYADTVRGFSKDGKYVIFSSNRLAANRGRPKLFKVSINGGYPKAMILPYANKLSLSPDNKKIAYTPYAEVYNQWKHYRGGTFTQIWIYSKESKSIKKIQQPKGNCNDTDPFWTGKTIYFRSDRNGEFNIFSYNSISKQIKQITRYKDFPVLNMRGFGNWILFEQAGRLVKYDIAKQSLGPLSIQIHTDLKEVRPRFSRGSRFIRTGDISPSGARAVFGFRGDIITVPAEKGDPRNITHSAATHDQFPKWSPDGKKIAFFSDSSGEYQMVIVSNSVKLERKTFKLNGAGFYTSISWSPDSQKICFTDNARNIFWISLDTGKITKINSEPHYVPGAFGSMFGNWSPDSNWITYHLNNTADMSQVYIYSIQNGKSHLLSDGLSDISEPVFDPSGKYLYFLVSTDAGPIKHWFDMSNSDKRFSNTIYFVSLQKETISPLAKENDEEKISKSKPKVKPKSKGEKKPKEIRIDFNNIEKRILALPIGMGAYANLQIGKTGEIFYLEFKPGTRGGILHQFNLKRRKDKVLGKGIFDYRISANHKKMLVRYRRHWAIVAAAKIKPGKGRLSSNSLSVKIDPKAEWKQIFHEAWRINRDYFYDPNMHGADWSAMRKKYEKFIPHLSCRQDLNRLIQWLCSELGVGHHRGGGGEFIDNPRRISVGLLGADYKVVNKRYQFKKVYGGLNWNPTLRSPLTEPGINVRAGEFLLKIDGKELSYPDNIYKYFENKVGKIVNLSIGNDDKGSIVRTVKVVPIAQEFTIRNRDWVEKNLAYVTKKTNGKVAYVYVPNTTQMGHTYFKRYFYPQSNREAIIVDERFNGGGQIADYYIDMLKKTYNCSWAYRYGKNQHSPSSAIFGPKVLLINEMAGSGGDLFPWMWRQSNLGKIIGTRTWGGLVGILGYPILMDGGRITAPNVGFWTEKEGFSVENEGVAPDIHVEQTPRLLIEGKDPQLDRAIEEILSELQKNPRKTPKRPSFPIRVKK